MLRRGFLCGVGGWLLSAKSRGVSGMAVRVDTATHVWSSTSVFAAGKEPPSNLGDEVASAGALVSSLKEQGLDRAVLVQPINYGFDHSYVARAIAASDGVFAGMLLADPSTPPAGVKPTLEALKEQGFTGVRVNPYLWSSKDNGWLADEYGKKLFEACAELEMPVGVMAFNGLLPLRTSLETLLAEYPTVPLIVDHWGFVRENPAASPDGQSWDHGAWAMLLELAKFPQVRVKLSAFFRVASTEGYSDLQPRFLELLAVYGPGRLVWGSDFPFCCLQKGGHGASLTALESWIRHLPQHDQEMILGGTATRLFFPGSTDAC